MATTLLQFAQQQEAARLLELQKAQAAQLGAAGADKAADGARVIAAAAAQGAGAAVDAVRRQLASAETPAEVAALSLQLKTTTVAWRGALDALAAQELVRARAGAALAAAQDGTAAAGKAHDTSVAALALAVATDKRQRALIDTALTQPPLHDVPANAAAALASADFAAAKTRIESALPQALRERARQRAHQAIDASAAAAKRLAGAQAAFDAEAEASKLDGDLIARLLRGFAAADAALSAYASGAVGRLASAAATLKQLAAATADPLTADQKASLDDLQGTVRPDAAAAEQARDDAALLLVAAAASYRAERIKALATRPDGDLATMEADAATFPALAQAKTDVDAAKVDHDAKALAFDAGKAQRLAEWQAEVPEALWSQAASFYAAEDALNALTAAPAALVTALDDARDLLLAALEKAAERQRRLDYVSAALDAETAFATAVGKRAGERGTLALRGALSLDPLLEP